MWSQLQRKFFCKPRCPVSAPVQMSARVPVALAERRIWFSRLVPGERKKSKMRAPWRKRADEDEALSCWDLYCPAF